MHPGLALTLFALASLGLFLIFRPRTGVFSRFLRMIRTSERVRLEDTLKHLLHCESMGISCTTDSVAGVLEASRGRALQLLSQLDRMGLARSEGVGHHLTDEGRSYALRLLRTHRLLERYLADRTGVPAEEWHERAEREEHLLTEAETERLAARMGHPVYDPHGDPIPSAGGVLPPSVGIPLTGVESGSVVRVVHLEDEPREAYDRLIARGLAPGMVLRVSEATPSMVRFICEGRDVSLAAVLAANVEVVAEAGSATMPQEPSETLAGLAVGDEAVVVDISPVCQGPQRRRLLDLGVIPGTTIRAVMTSASGDPVAYEIRGALIALRHQQAEWIRVKRSSGEQGEAA